LSSPPRPWLWLKPPSKFPTPTEVWAKYNPDADDLKEEIMSNNALIGRIAPIHKTRERKLKQRGAKLPKEQRRTRTNITQFEKPENQTLVPSGLLGPVTLQTGQNM
jgi:hypothetical protein